MSSLCSSPSTLDLLRGYLFVTRLRSITEEILVVSGLVVSIAFVRKVQDGNIWCDLIELGEPGDLELFMSEVQRDALERHAK